MISRGADPVVAAGRQGKGDAARATTTVLCEGARFGRLPGLRDDPSTFRIYLRGAVWQGAKSLPEKDKGPCG